MINSILPYLLGYWEILFFSITGVSLLLFFRAIWRKKMTHRKISEYPMEFPPKEMPWFVRGDPIRLPIGFIEKVIAEWNQERDEIKKNFLRGEFQFPGEYAKKASVLPFDKLPEGLQMVILQRLWARSTEYHAL